jgi:SPP1 family predicted phage head-tail adaptor
MFFSDKITLRSYTITKDDYGDPVETPVDVNVWANRKSVKRSEFYAANTSGINASVVFEIHVEDYNNQSCILDGTKEYNVIRTYQTGLGTIEITCSDKAV